MDLNGHPCSFLDTHLICVSKSCDHISCYGEASVLVEYGPKYGIDDTIRRVTCVYILMSISKFCSFHKV